MTHPHRAGDGRQLNAFFVGLARLVHDRAIDPLRRQARSRAGKVALARLDDRLLRDIGLTRSQAHAAAYGLLKLGRHAPEEAERAPRGPDDGRPQRRSIVPSAGGTTAAPLVRRAAGG